MARHVSGLSTRTTTIVADFIGLIALTFGVGLAISLVMAAVVVLLTGPQAVASDSSLPSSTSASPRQSVPANGRLDAPALPGRAVQI